MNFKEYQDKSAETAVYPIGIRYPILGLLGEAGEIAEKISHRMDEGFGKKVIMLSASTSKLAEILKKIIRDKDSKIGDEEKEKIFISVKVIFRRLFAIVQLFNFDSTRVADLIIGPPIEDKKIDISDQEIGKEIADQLWYLSALSRELKLDLNELAEQNIIKLMSRKERDVISGSGDNR